MKKIEIKGKKVFIEGVESILYGGEFQYFRIPKTTWKTSLQYLKDAGMNFISFYIPWIWHEYEEGKFDFKGETLPERDFEYFLKLCNDFDFNVMVRPGPYIYAEYQGFGLPEWLREKHPEILIQYEDGTKSHEVSLNHPTYLSYTQKWYKSLFEVLDPYFKNNMIFSCQLDNETGLPQFGNVPYMSDMNPDTVEKFKEYCKSKFNTIDDVNKYLKTNYKDFSEIESPKKSENKHYFRVYGEFIEDYIVDYLSNLKKMVLDLGYDTFFYLNDPYLCHWPHHSIKKSKIAPIGYDTYPKFSTDNSTNDLPFTLSYATEFFNSFSKDFPTIGAEVGAGWFDPRVTVKPEATMQLSMLSIIRNTKILAYYLLQDCVEHDGYEWIFKAPIDVKGNITPRYEAVKEVGLFLKEYSNLICNSEEIYSPIGLGIYIPHMRDMVRSNINYWAIMSELNKALLHFNGASGMQGVLIESGYNPKVFDLEVIEQSELKKLKVIFIFSIGHIDKDSYKKLQKFVYDGGTLITLGYPITEYDSGDLIEKNNLYPAEPYSSSNSTNFGITNMASSTSYDIVSYSFSRSKIKHKQSLHTIDMLQPMAEAIRHITKHGTWIETDKGKKFWASRFVSTWKSTGGINPLLKYGGLTVGYSARYGHGKSIFLGTLAGIFYDSPVYYSIESEKKSSITNFFSLLIKELGVKPIHNPIPNIEVVIRKLENSMLIFIVNRGEARDFNIETDFEFYENVEQIFSSKEESIVNNKYFKNNRILKGKIGSDDIIGVHIN